MNIISVILTILLLHQNPFILPTTKTTKLHKKTTNMIIWELGQKFKKWRMSWMMKIWLLRNVSHFSVITVARHNPTNPLRWYEAWKGVFCMIMWPMWALNLKTGDEDGSNWHKRDVPRQLNNFIQNQMWTNFPSLHHSSSNTITVSKRRITTVMIKKKRKNHSN